jgi:hypothetical protein
LWIFNDLRLSGLEKLKLGDREWRNLHGVFHHMVKFSTCPL